MVNLSVFNDKFWKIYALCFFERMFVIIFIFLKMLTCAVKTQVHYSNIEIIYWNVCIAFNL